MCTENVKNKNDLIEEIKKIEDAELNIILEACKKIKNIDDFINEIELIKNNFNNLKENTEKDINEIKYNYKQRFSDLFNKMSHFYSKLGDTETKFLNKLKELYEKFDLFKTNITNSISSLDIKIEKKINDGTKGTNKLLWAIIILFLSAVITFITGKIQGWL